MEVRDVIITHVIGPLVMLVLIAVYTPISKWDAVTTTTAAAFPLLLLWYAGRWHLASVWLRQALPLAVLVIAAVSGYRARRLPVYRSNGGRTWMLRAAKGLLIAFMSVRLIPVFEGRQAPAQTVSLDVPLRGGTFYVGQGGSTRALNYHAVDETQRYAVDIVKLTPAGNRGSRLYPRSLREYASYGSPVYAPCSGRVQEVESMLSDNTPPSERDRVRPAGNHILLRCEGTDVDIMLAHLQEGSVRVRAGEHVRVQAPLAAIGNSGNSTEPHLHIHAQRGQMLHAGMKADGIAITFDGHFLSRNAVIRR